MDKKFHPAMKAIKAGDVERLLVAEDPSLATSRSTRSHPTLLQCLALDAKGDPNGPAAGWAEHGKHPDLLDLLR